MKEGWKAVYDNMFLDEEEDDKSGDQLRLAGRQLPTLKKGQEVDISQIMRSQGKTKPPARFIEATLLSAMENPVRYMESDNVKERKTLGETGGLGTVATRADIIEKLFHTFLIEKNGNEIRSHQRENNC